MGIAKRAKPYPTTEIIDQLLAVTPEAMVILEADGRMVGFNTQAEKLFGYSQAQLLGHKTDLLMPKRWSERNRKRRRCRAVRTKIGPFGYGLESVVRRRDGTEFPARVNAALLKGAHTLISSNFRGIHREPCKQLNLRALVEASDDAIIGKTLSGTITSWNKGAEKICGYKAEEILGKPISVLMPPSPNGFCETMMRLWGGGEHIQCFETTRIHKNGHPIEVSVTISPVKSRGGVVVGACEVARDITEKTQAHAALRRSEERFRLALEHAPLVVCSRDLELRYTWISSTVVAWQRQEYLGRTDTEIIGGEDGSRLTAIKEEVLRTGIESHTEATITIQGVKHYFDLVVDPLRDVRGKLMGLLSFAIDITSLKETIFKLQEALDHIQVLRGLLPICASCKNIKDEHERWQPLEGFIQARSEAKFTHGICPDCMRKLYPEY